MQRTPDILLVLVVCASTLAACRSPASSDEAAADAASSFATFAGGVYSQLESTPLDPGVETSVGLFGDLNVMAGESVVMGRYRYRVDTTHSDPLGQMTFHVSPAHDRALAVPVVLEFTARRGTWQLEQARYVSANVGPELKQTLDARLEDWVRTGVQRTRSDTALR